MLPDYISMSLGEEVYNLFAIGNSDRANHWDSVWIPAYRKDKKRVLKALRASGLSFSYENGPHGITLRPRSNLFKALSALNKLQIQSTRFKEPVWAHIDSSFNSVDWSEFVVA